jgi:acetylornithine deacetylase/succinyl-diaminopimelate desuccinylase-like protein
MAVATRHLGGAGFAPEGTLIYLAVADEEALGSWGADHLLKHERDAVAADYVVTESGGIPIPTPNGIRLPVIVGEKGTWWCTLRVKGTPGHASQPLRTDNALVKAAEVVRRIAEYRPQADIHETWRRTVEGLGLPGELAEAALDPDRLYDLCLQLPLGMARMAHACTHTTFAPTVIHGGVKTNVIPDTVDLQVDIRTLPGQTSDEIRALVHDAIGDLMSDVEIVNPNDDPSTASPLDTPLWDALARVTKAIVPESSLMPMLTVGATDSRFFRRAGSVAYGFGLFSGHLTFDDYAVMFHGDDERVDVESLGLSTQLWDALARDFLA